MANKLIFIIGMHRSLTSFVASMVAKAFGGFIAEPEHLLRGGSLNRPGFFESKRVYRLNERILTASDMTWRTTRSMPLVSVPFRDDILSVLRGDFSHRPVSVIKDPRLCYMAPIWYAQALELYDPLDIHALYVLRHPMQVIQSLAKAHGMPFAEAIDMWLYHNARALYFLQGFDDLTDEARFMKWRVIDTSDGDGTHFAEVLRSMKAMLMIPQFAEPDPASVFRPKEKHFSSLLPPSETIPASVMDELSIAIEMYLKLKKLSEDYGFTPRVCDLEVACGTRDEDDD